MVHRAWWCTMYYERYIVESSSQNRLHDRMRGNSARCMIHLQFMHAWSIDDERCMNDAQTMHALMMHPIYVKLHYSSTVVKRGRTKIPFGDCVPLPTLYWGSLYAGNNVLREQNIHRLYGLVSKIDQTPLASYDAYDAWCMMITLKCVYKF